jgi:hypothetical protein
VWTWTDKICTAQDYNSSRSNRGVWLKEEDDDDDNTDDAGATEYIILLADLSCGDAPPGDGD